MENFNKEQKEKLLYAIKWAFKIAEINDYEGIKHIKERGGMSIYKDKEKRKTFYAFKDGSVALNKLFITGRAAKEDIKNGDYTDCVKDLIREYDLMKDIQSVKLAKEEPIKELVLENEITCKKCKAKSVFTKEILAGINITEDVKLYCDECDSIIAIVKAKNRWTKYKATCVKDGIKETILLEAIDIEHAEAKLLSKGYVADDITEILNTTKPSSLENVNLDMNEDFLDFDKNPPDEDIIKANEEILSKQDEDENENLKF